MLEQSSGLLPESAIADRGQSVPANLSSMVARRSKSGGTKNHYYPLRKGTGFGLCYRINSMQYISKNWVVRIFNKTVNGFVGRLNMVLLPEKLDV